MLPVVSVYPIALLAAALLAWRGLVRRDSGVKVVAGVRLALYLGWLVGATLFPLPLQHAPAGEGFGTRLNHPNLIPIAGIRATLEIPGTWPHVRLLAGNVLVFAPFGLLLPTVWPRFHDLRRMTLPGLAVSLSIELAQLGMSLVIGTWFRMSDVDDVLLGYGLWRALNSRCLAAAAGEARLDPS